MASIASAPGAGAARRAPCPDAPEPTRQVDLRAALTALRDAGGDASWVHPAGVAASLGISPRRANALLRELLRLQVVRRDGRRVPMPYRISPLGLRVLSVLVPDPAMLPPASPPPASTGRIDLAPLLEAGLTVQVMAMGRTFLLTGLGETPGCLQVRMVAEDLPDLALLERFAEGAGPAP